MSREYVAIQNARKGIKHDTTDEQLRKIAGALTRSNCPKGGLAVAYLKLAREESRDLAYTQTINKENRRLNARVNKLQKRLSHLRSERKNLLEIAMGATNSVGISFSSVASILDEYSLLDTECSDE